LVRTSASPDTFAFLGGDLSHHNGELRPSVYCCIPSEVHLGDDSQATLTDHAVYPGSCFENLLTERGRTTNQSFFDDISGYDIPVVKDTVKKASLHDAQENVWFIPAHDDNLLGVVDLFPLSLNDWKSKDWKQKLQWAFLKDFVPAIRGADSSRV
jgi:hypothetical protein